MRHILIRHSHSQSVAATGVVVDVAYARRGMLELSFKMTGQIGDISLPKTGRPKRADQLWRRTCFEAFIAASPDGSYYEFNLSPSTEWAVYLFDNYRNGMVKALEAVQPNISTEMDDASFTLDASFDLSELSALDLAMPLRLGFSAIIEENGGRNSYWALAHPPGKPDFHHADCFACELSGPVK